MYRGRVAIVLVGVLVLTAGCLGGSVPDVPDGGTDASDDDGSGGADGTGDGGTDAGDVTLVDDRTATLQAAGSFTSEFRMRIFEDDELVSETRYAASVDYERERSSFRMRMVSGGEVQADTVTYHADGVNYQYAGSEDYESYQAFEADFDPRVASSLQTNVNSAGHLEEFTADGTETFDGVRVTRYVRTEQPTWLSAQQVDEGEFQWTEFTYEVLIDDDGLVRSEQWSGEGVDEDGSTVRIEYSSTVTGIGSTEVAEPDWIDEAGTPIS